MATFAICRYASGLFHFTVSITCHTITNNNQDDPLCDMPPGAGWPGLDGGCSGTGAQGGPFAPPATGPEDEATSQDADVLSSAPVLPVAWVAPPRHALNWKANSTADVALPAGVGEQGRVIPGPVLHVDSLDALVAAINAHLEAPLRKPGRTNVPQQAPPLVQGAPRARPSWWH